MPTLYKALSLFLEADKINNLKKIGIHNIIEFVEKDPELLCCQSKISYKDIVKIRNVLLAQYSALPQNGSDLYETCISSLAIFSTGCERLDSLLDGGIFNGEVTEFVGPPASGKSQLCFSLAATVASESQRNVLYLDTSGTFSAGRLLEIVSNHISNKEHIDTALKKVYCCPVHDIFQLLQLLENISFNISQQTGSFHSELQLIILDAVTPVLAPHIGGKQMDGLGLMVRLSQQLMFLASEHLLAIVVCNNTVQGEKGIIKPALGRYWQHVASVSLKLDLPEERSGLTKMEGYREASILKSCRRATGQSTSIRLSSKGVEGVHHKS
ncbi:DNA repair protein RAD51 homolog 4-like isoform X1 [Tachypleus tridentatus]|uniref:DNA repair protein RAD51 homolog 4-like isoform X1 n=1 Tax=Tachypleus tridentatus TaxID=6853 RepID=UPI003FD1E8ED